MAYSIGDIVKLNGTKSARIIAVIGDGTYTVKCHDGAVYIVSGNSLLTAPTDRALEELFALCREKMRYGDLSKEFSFDELADYAKIKFKRGTILRDINKLDKALDDILDAVNIALRAAQKIKEQIDGEKQEAA